MAKPTIGVFGLTGCAGDQLVLLNCEDELLELAQLVDIRDFLMANSANDTECRLDLALVDGAVLSRRDEEDLKKIRERSNLLVALGTCAVWGGVAAMDRYDDRSRRLAEVYGEAGAKYDSLPARALHEVVKVDLSIPGCPIDKQQLLAAVASLLNGDLPVLPQYPVCTECRWRENNCLLIEKGLFCCGPVTAAGCGALCPSLNIPCVGCRGPAADANLESALAMYREKGYTPEEIAARLRTFAPQAVGGEA